MDTNDAERDEPAPQDTTPANTAAASTAPPPAAEPAAPAPPVNPWAPPGSHATPPPPAPPATAGPWAGPVAGPGAGPGAAPGPVQPGWPPAGHQPGGYPYTGSPYGGYPYGGGPTGQPGTDGFAIASLVTGLTCCLWPLALGFGITSLVRISKARRRGQGMAAAGVVLGVLGLLASIFGAIGLIRASSSPWNSAGVASLRIGECFNQPSLSEQRVVVVPCTTPHYGEVAFISLLTGDGDGNVYPGQLSADTQAATACQLASESYVTDLWSLGGTMSTRYFYPTATSWERGNRFGTCFLHDTNGPSSGSVRRDASNLDQSQQDFLRAVHALDRNDPVRKAENSGPFWLSQTAGGVDEAVSVLGAQSWPGSAKPEIDALLGELRAEQPSWDAGVQTDQGAAETIRLNHLVDEKLIPLERAARSALHLADQDQRDPSALPGTDAPGSAAGSAV